jgi:hypothetical protein
MQRGAVNAMGKAFGVLKTWETMHPVPGPRWVCWPYMKTGELVKPEEQRYIEVLEKRD